jgi:hypothetical protein
MTPRKYAHPAVPLLQRFRSPQLTGLLVPVVLAAQERRLFTEDRKIYAVVAGLVVVALALSLLTVGYWRWTRPAQSEPTQTRRTVAPTVASGRTARQAVAGADHVSSDETWESHATGEHQRIEAPKRGTARPDAAARRAALERPSRPS